MSKKAIVVGASGLVGESILKTLLNAPEYSEVLVIVRNKLGIEHNKLQQLVVDFDNINSYASEITGDVLFSALGSTKKKTPDLKLYRKIDHDYTINLAKIACKNGVKEFHLISAMGANANSFNFYTKMKGETEEDAKTLGFDTLYIYRPSLLVGDRKESRLMEGLAEGFMKIINPLLSGSWKKYRSIHVDIIGNAMYKLSLKGSKGIITLDSEQIKEADN